MRALLWKDWRLVSSLVVATTVLYILPMTVAAVWILFSSNTDRPLTTTDWLVGIAGMFCFGLGVSLLATPMYGAIMFARERRDRTVELTASMPIPRARIVLSKAIVLTGLTLTPWILTLVFMVVLGTITKYVGSIDHWNNEMGVNDRQALPAVLMMLGIAVLAVGSGWLFSTLLNSETLSAGLSFIATILTVSLFFAIWFRLAPSNDRLPHGILAGLTWGMGLSCFVCGTVVALRRGSP